MYCLLDHGGNVVIGIYGDVIVDVGQFVNIRGTEEGRSGGGSKVAVLLPLLQNRVGNVRSAVGDVRSTVCSVIPPLFFRGGSETEDIRGEVERF